MIQSKHDDLPFDYRNAKCLVPALPYRNYASALNLFYGLSKSVTLRREYDDSLIFQVGEDGFWGELGTESKTICYYQAKNKSRLCHRIPLSLVDALRERFRREGGLLQVGVLDDYIVFTDVDCDLDWHFPYLREAVSIVAWCKYSLAEEPEDHGALDSMALGFVNGMALFKHPALKRGDLFTLTCDNQNLYLDNERFADFEPLMDAKRIEPVSVVIPRFTFARIFLRIMRFSRGICTPCLTMSSSGVKIIAPDVAFFVKAA